MHIVIAVVFIAIFLRALQKVKNLGNRVNHLDKQVSGLKKKVSSLEVLATQDPLTEVFNRRGGEKVLNHHISLLSRNNNSSNKGLAIILLDLDRFKTINDTYGHSTGDMVLKFFVSVLSSVLRRDHDVIVRIGGDEFYVIAPGCDLEGAKAMREKIHCAFKERQFTEEGLALSVSASMGIATSHRGNGSLRNLDGILELADRVLYSNKEIARR